MNNELQHLDSLSNFHLSQELFNSKNYREQKNKIQQQQNQMQTNKVNISSLDFNKTSKKKKIFKRKKKTQKTPSFSKVKNKKEILMNWDKLYEDFESQQNDGQFDGSFLENSSIRLQFFSKDEEQQLIEDSLTLTQQAMEIDILEFIRQDKEKQNNKKLYPCKECNEQFTKAALGGHMTKAHPKK